MVDGTGSIKPVTEAGGLYPEIGKKKNKNQFNSISIEMIEGLVKEIQKKT